MKSFYHSNGSKWECVLSDTSHSYPVKRSTLPNWIPYGVPDSLNKKWFSWTIHSYDELHLQTGQQSGATFRNWIYYCCSWAFNSSTVMIVRWLSEINCFRFFIAEEWVCRRVHITCSPTWNELNLHKFCLFALNFRNWSCYSVRVCLCVFIVLKILNDFILWIYLLCDHLVSWSTLKIEISFAD